MSGYVCISKVCALCMSKRALLFSDFDVHCVMNMGKMALLSKVCPSKTSKLKLLRGFQVSSYLYALCVMMRALTTLENDCVYEIHIIPRTILSLNSQLVQLDKMQKVTFRRSFVRNLAKYAADHLNMDTRVSKRICFE